MRHTKIIATIGPASDSDEMLERLVAGGVDIFRLNFSHGTHESHGRTIERIRGVSTRAGREVAILQDLGGPKIRTGSLERGQPVRLESGASVRIGTGTFAGTADRLSTSYAGLARAVKPGDRLLLSDGAIELRVERSDGSEIDATVVEGGELGEHKGINAPGVALPASAITLKDIDDLRFGLAHGVDMVAVSFVQCAADLRQARRLIADDDGGDVPIIAKLERPQALDDLGAILDACDGVMVARGDLGLEMPLERVPRAQKDITRAARAKGIPVIVATQVLESMTVHLRPTRAEVSDAANAVADGVDAIMLADETAIGVNAARAVQTLDAIISDAEAAQPGGPRASSASSGHDHTVALCEAAVTLASRGEARAIVAVTRGGSTARRLSALRPEAPVYATTDRADTARRLSLYRGVVPVCTDIGEDVASARVLIGEQLVARHLLAPGQVVVFVSINADLTREDANYLKIHRL